MVIGALIGGQALGWAMQCSTLLTGSLTNKKLRLELQSAIALTDWTAAIAGGAVRILVDLLASLLLTTSILLLVECLAAWQATVRPRQPLAQQSNNCQSHGADAADVDTPAPRTAILMPAYNEAAVITETLADIQAQLRQEACLAQTELWVIADNCTDSTAELCRQAGVRVVERHSLDRGKGYALDYGLQQIGADPKSTEPPEFVVMIDADCRVQPGAIAALVQAATRHRCPIQGNYYMTLPTGATTDRALKDRITVFATKVKNEIRSLGLFQLGFPCLLLGSGMAFPWKALQGISLASGDLVEDMKLGFDLALTQQPPLFCREAIITADLPQTQAAARSQRTRWEHGRLNLTQRYWPKLMQEGLRQKQFGLIALALDMAILPLSLLVTLWFALSCVAALLGYLGHWEAMAICIATGGCIAGSILLAWIRVGRQVLPFRQLMLVPLFILWKLPIFFSFILSPQRSWVRTKRDPA